VSFSDRIIRLKKSVRNKKLMDPNTNQQQGGQVSDPAAVNEASLASKEVPVAVVPVVESEGKTIPEEPLETANGSQAPVFSRDAEQNAETPGWMEDASEKAVSDKIVEVADNEVDVEQKPDAPVVTLRSEKPTDTELGQNPSSLIEIKPSIEVVKKADDEASEKLTFAGYDPKTGKKLYEKGKEVVVDEAVSEKPVKKSFFASLFPFLVKKNAQVAVKGAEKNEVKGAKLSLSEKEKKEFLEAEKIYQEGLASIKDLIAPASMEIQYDSIKIDGVYAKSFYVFAYPRYLESNWLSPVINFDVTMDISQFIYPITSGEIMKTLKKKVAQMQSSMSINSEKGKFVILHLRLLLRMRRFLELKFKGGRKSFSNLLYILLFMRRVRRSLRRFLSSWKVYLQVSSFLQRGLNFRLSMPLILVYRCVWMSFILLEI